MRVGNHRHCVRTARYSNSEQFTRQAKKNQKNVADPVPGQTNECKPRENLEKKGPNCTLEMLEPNGWESCGWSLLKAAVFDCGPA